MSFIASQRETCTIIGDSRRRRRPRPHDVAHPLDAARRAVGVVNVVAPARPAIRPTWVRIASTVSGDISWFFGANGSIDGQIVVYASGETQSGGNRRSVKT